MQTIERIPRLEERATFHWSRFLLESVLAIGGALALTGLIALFHLYPRIPNISFVYLLLILLLASTFGRYGAVLASVTAFLAFDFFSCRLSIPLQLRAGRNGSPSSSSWSPRS